MNFKSRNSCSILRDGGTLLLELTNDEGGEFTFFLDINRYGSKDERGNYTSWHPPVIRKFLDDDGKPVKEFDWNTAKEFIKNINFNSDDQRYMQLFQRMTKIINGNGCID